MTALPVYRVLTDAARPLFEWHLHRRIACGKEDRERYPERRGEASRDRPDGTLVWMHATSVGEARSALTLIKAMSTAVPASKTLVTTDTATSARMMAEHLPARCIHQYAPLDRRAWVNRFLDHWRPQLALFVESELWPNRMLECQRRGIPLALINGRLSVYSFARWRRFPRTARHLFGLFNPCFAQTEEQVDKLRHLGAAEARCIGDLKLSAPPLPCDTAGLDTLREAIGARPLWLAASTHAGEEALAAEVHTKLAAGRPNLLTVIVPRHPERGKETARLLTDSGHTVVRRSEGRLPTPEDSIYLADTLGELGLFYRLAGVAFIGGSTAAHGGHNPAEAAQLNCAILHGPDMTNFAAMADSLAACGGAVTVDGAEALAASIGGFLDNEKACRRSTEAAAAFIASHEGAAGRIATEITSLLNKSSITTQAGDATS